MKQKFKRRNFFIKKDLQGRYIFSNFMFVLAGEIGAPLKLRNHDEGQEFADKLHQFSVVMAGRLKDTAEKQILK